MDNRQRPLREYFDAARSEPGISEAEVRAIIEAGAAKSGKSQARTLHVRPAIGLLFCLALLLVAGGIYYGWHTESTRPDLASAPPQSERRGGTERDPQQGTPQQETPLSPEVPAEAAAPSPQIPATMPVVDGGTAKKERDNWNWNIGNQRIDNPSMLQENERMKFANARAIAATALAALSATALSAQTEMQIENRKKDTTPEVFRRMERDLGQAVYDYWIPKLNDYKARIDRTLSERDLAELNRLRVRFGVLAADFIRNEQGPKGEIEVERKRLMSEISGLVRSTSELATRYRGDMDNLGTTVVRSMIDFFPVIAEQGDRFIAANREEIERSGKGAMVRKVREEANKLGTTLNSGLGRSTVQMVYGMSIEPLVMLYDGTELKTLFRQLETLATQKMGLPFSTSAVTGYALPESSVLKQSAPNPASTSARIIYMLTEPSERGLLRLYNAQGELVESFDQGARPAGEHQVTIDVSKLPAGTYLYHLTVATSKGEQVYSRTMQVTR